MKFAEPSKLKRNPGGWGTAGSNSKCNKSFKRNSSREALAAAAVGSVAKWEASFAFQLFHRPSRHIAQHHLVHRIALIADQRDVRFVALGP